MMKLLCSFLLASAIINTNQLQNYIYNNKQTKRVIVYGDQAGSLIRVAEEKFHGAIGFIIKILHMYSTKKLACFLFFHFKNV